MRIDGLRLYLRDTRLSDLDKRHHWEFVDTEWKNWDAPWEYAHLDQLGLEQESERYLSNLRRRLERADWSPDSFRFGFEIILKDGDEHIGWVNCYDIDERFNWTPGINVLGTAIGLVIPSLEHRGKGYGFEAVNAYLDYFRSIGYREIYCQTWSGNTAMTKLALRLGFQEVQRKKRSRKVRGEAFDGLTYWLEFD